jgi:hypothetical protein
VDERHRADHGRLPGTPVSGLIELAGGTATPLGALLVGGYFGTWAEIAAALPRPFSSAALRGDAFAVVQLFPRLALQLETRNNSEDPGVSRAREIPARCSGRSAEAG